jgi:hypothetical protein
MNAPPLSAMRSGTVGDDGRSSHDTAIVTSALLLFCRDVQKDVSRLMMCGQDDSAKELFCAAAKHQLLDPNSRAPILQNIVEEVLANDDGLPSFPPEYNETLAELMMVYPSARAAYVAGPDAARVYRGNMVTTFCDMPVHPAPLCVSADMQFLVGVERSENEWDTFDPARPFECAVHRFVESINTMA